MKYIKAGLGAAVVIALGAISFRIAQAQQGPGSDSSETIARPRKKNPPADTVTDPATIDPAPSSNPPPSNDEPAVEEPKIPSKFTRREKELPADSPTFSS